MIKTIGKPLTTKAVAQVLGVSDATVKRWADDQTLLSEKTAGGHRRFRVEEVARFRREFALSLQQRAASFSVSTLPKQLKSRSTESGKATAKLSPPSLVDALLAGNEEAVTELLIGEHLRGRKLTTIFDEVISPAMRRIGDLWYAGKLTIAHEHVATRTTIVATQVLRAVIASREPTELVAICCAVENDFHELPVLLAQMLVESQGWKVVNLGANTPFFSLEETMTSYAPQLVCIASTMLLDVERAAREYRELHHAATRAKIKIVLGGAGFAPKPIRQRFPADLHAKKFGDLLRFINTSH